MKQVIKNTVLCLILAPIAYFVSDWFPDIDLMITIPGIIVHRSAITHSFLIVFVFMLLSARFGTIVFRIVTLCAAIGLAEHLLLDMFPNKWHGYALIHVPFYGRTNGVLSFIWLAFNVFIAFRCVFIRIEQGKSVSFKDILLKRSKRENK